MRKSLGTTKGNSIIKYINKRQSNGKGGAMRQYSILMKELKKNKLLKKDLRIFDIGCGTGDFLWIVEDKIKCNTFGLDISEYTIKEASRKLKNSKLFLLDIQNRTDFIDGFFDVITMFEVIEHLSRPVDAIEEIHRILKPNGILIISTRNVNSLERFLFKENSCIIDPSHILLFSPFSLRIFIERCGFNIIEQKAIFETFPRYLQFVINKTRLGSTILVVANKIKNFGRVEKIVNEERKK